MAGSEIAPPFASHDVSGRPRLAAAACLVVAGVAVVPLLYVGSFAYLTLDALNHWGVRDSLDHQTVAFLREFYSPLIWLCERMFG